MKDVSIYLSFVTPYRVCMRTCVSCLPLYRIPEGIVLHPCSYVIVLRSVFCVYVRVRIYYFPFTYVVVHC